MNDSSVVDIKTHGRSAAWLVMLLALIALYLTSLYNFLLFHSLAEGFAIVVAGGLFMVAWNTRHLVDRHYLLFLGIAYPYVALLDLLHTLAYQGMSVFPGFGADLPTQLWIAGRYLEALALLAAPIFLKRRFNPWVMAAALGLITGLVVASIFWWRVFPMCYTAETGLTPFKTVSEYLISGILLVTGWVIYVKRAELGQRVFRLMLGAVACTVIAEMLFTLYVSVYGFSNLAGHFFKIASYFLVYKAIIETSLSRPFETLFRDLKKRELALAESEERFRTLVRNTASVIIFLDPDLKVREFNLAAQALFGMNREEILGESFIGRLVPQAHERQVAELLQGVLAGRQVKGAETPMSGRDGGQPTLLWNSLSLQEPDGEVLGVVISGQDISGRIQAEQEREALIKELSQALAEIKTLGGLLPICSNCKKIRNDQGYWQKLEHYISSHSDATFSHGLCPDCVRALYPDLYGPNDKVPGE